MANAQLTNYTIPTTLDTPVMDVAILENHYADGPYGAKGLGELPIDGPAPAIANAIRSLGIDVREVPATPESVMLASLDRRADAEQHAHALAYSGAPVPRGGMDGAERVRDGDRTLGRPDDEIAAGMGAGG